MADYWVSPTATSGAGSFADPWTLAQLGGATIGNDDRVFIIEGSYTLAGTSGLTLCASGESQCQFIVVKANGDFDPDARAVIDATAVTSGVAITFEGDKSQVFGLVVNGCNGSNGILVDADDCCLVCCAVTDSTGVGINVVGNGNKLILCRSEDNNNDGFIISTATSGLFVHCISNDNVSDGFTVAASSDRVHFVRCIAYGNNNTGFTLDGNCSAIHCTAYNNGSHGFWCVDDHNLLVNVASWDNGGFGLNFDEETSQARDMVIRPFIGTGADANTSGPFDADDGGTDTGVWDYTGIIAAALGGDGASQTGVVFGPVGGLATVASGTDLTPVTGSPMIDAGVALPYTARGDNTIDLGAIESAGNAAAGGALNPNILGVM